MKISMRKFLSITLLVFATTTLSAKSLNYLNFTPPSSLALELAHNQNFQSFNIKMLTFLNKIEENHFNAIFKKVVLKQATYQETNLFLQKMSYSNLEVFNSFQEEIFNIKTKLAQDFPILTRADNKQSISDALAIMSKEKILPQFNQLKPTCEDLYTLALVACLELYPEGGQDLAGCEIAAFDAYALCEGA